MVVIDMGMDQGDVHGLAQADDVAVVHGDHPHHLGLAAVAGKLQHGHHGRVRGVLVPVHGLFRNEIGGALGVLLHLHVHGGHLLGKFVPAIGAGVLIVDIKPGRPAVHIVLTAGLMDVRRRVAAVAGPGQLIGGAVQGVVHLAGSAAVIYLGHIGAAGIEDPDARGGQHCRAQQAQQKDGGEHTQGDQSVSHDLTPLRSRMSCCTSVICPSSL